MNRIGMVQLSEISLKTIVIAALLSLVSVLIFKTAAARETLVIGDCSLRGIDLVMRGTSATRLKIEVRRLETIHADVGNNGMQQRLVHAVLYVADDRSERPEGVSGGVNKINRLGISVARKVYILGDEGSLTSDKLFGGSLDTGNIQCR